MFDYLVILDFEATCDNRSRMDPQEIIEFPSVLYDVETREVVDEFSTFVRPEHHPQLTAFCTELTGITQAEVADAPPFRGVLHQHIAWLSDHGLLQPGRAERFALVTCGDWDLNAMLPQQCEVAGVSIGELPACYRRWINIKHIFEATLHKRAGGMVSMLRQLNLKLEGRHHRGIDDCRNITRIARELQARGAEFKITKKLSASRYPPLALELVAGERVEAMTLQKRTVASLLGQACSLFRAKVVALKTEDGQLLDDERLLVLRPQTRLEVVFRGS